ncbi:hypothetical protein [Nodosilinea sp. E11]|uniref:hypothetical protein n=1 Tax=Nodosilinea sp. E11 TaxID=3037479 RepID=UPI0029352C46|nr:hypothetical protein [Nodosilinea sp. E11]WOD40267.1 hypothetical protein RRF56_05610 [Nodosilinea sp. E11]
MNSKPPQTHLKTLSPSAEEDIEGAIAEAIEAAHLLLSSLENQVKLGFFTAPAETKIVRSDEPPSPLEDDRFSTDWL